MGSLLCLFVQHKAVGIPDQRSVVCVEEHLIWKLFIGLGTAEAKDEQMAMGVRAGETLTIGSEFAVKNSSVTLAFNHVEVMLCVCASQQVPYEHVPIVASRQDDPGVKRVRFEDKHLCLVAFKDM